MENEIALAPLVIPNAHVVPPFVLHVEYDDNVEFNDDELSDQWAYQSLLHMGFNPVDETGDMTPLPDMGFAFGPRGGFVMDRQTIFHEFEQIHNGAGNQILQEFLNQTGRLVLISKYYEIYVFQPQLNMVQNG